MYYVIVDALGAHIIMHHKDIFSNSACSDLPKSFFLKFLY